MKRKIDQLLRQLSKETCKLCKYSSTCSDIKDCPLRPIMLELIQVILEDKHED